MDEFFEVEPPSATHQKKRITTIYGFPRMYDSPALVKAKDLYDQMLEPCKPACPWTGPLKVKLAFLSTPPASRKLKGDAMWKPTRPDCDNLAKTLLDRMARMGYFRNDAQVSVLKVSKLWSKTPGIMIAVWSLE